MSRQVRSPSMPRVDCSPGVLTTMAILQRARDLAHTLGRDPWDFAEEMQSLWAAGATNSDLRALLLQGVVANAQETSPLHSVARTFQKIKNLSMPERTCFVLTEKGEALARTRKLPAIFRSSRAHGPLGNGKRHHVSLLPVWLADLRELWVGNMLIKAFHRPAQCQEIVLSAFEEQQWAPRIDDPLPRVASREAKHCLHDTINHLNRNQEKPLIHFFGDGTGRGIRWEFCGTMVAPDRHQNGSCTMKK